MILWTSCISWRNIKVWASGQKHVMVSRPVSSSPSLHIVVEFVERANNFRMWVRGSGLEFCLSTALLVLILKLYVQKQNYELLELLRIALTAQWATSVHLLTDDILSQKFGGGITQLTTFGHRWLHRVPDDLSNRQALYCEQHLL